MSFLRCLTFSFLVIALCAPSYRAGDKTTDPPKGKVPLAVEELAEKVQKSVVVILYTSREGKQVGLGSGFVVDSEKGLIATNLHVIGEGRPITVQLPDGKKVEAVAVHATDKKSDLAIIQIPVKGLPPLSLANSDAIKTGQPIVALGHPRGLEHSVVAGVLSGRREVEGIKMLQLAIPIEQGNSGGPVLDGEGKVVGIVTMKSLITANLGFAVPVNALKPLIAKPHSIPMESWLTIGALDKSEWKPIMGGRWRQRAGRIHADGAGTGFGGRTLCLYQREVPKFPFEITVTVKLDDEAGAAGLIFGGDDSDRHFGFYPTGGKMRLTRFNGPDVFSWKIMQDIPTDIYRPGEWNTLKVRVEEKQFTCFLNGQPLIENVPADYFGSTVGLAKFRETVAEYKKFQMGDRVGGGKLTEGLAKLIDKAIADLPAKAKPDEVDVKPLAKHGDAGLLQLRDRARQLEKQAAQLRELALRVHHERCLADIKMLFKEEEGKVDLVRAALHLARLDNEDLDVEAYHREIDRLAKGVKELLPKDAGPEKRLEALNDYLFKKRGFHGSRGEYYTRANSYLNEVIDDREGLPITLSVLYIDLARHLDLKVVGVALPGHFVVRFEGPKAKPQLIDVFEGGVFLSEEDADARVRKITGMPLDEDDLKPVGPKAIIMRMAHNLLNVAQQERDLPGMIRYLDVILTVDPEAHEERWVRAVFRFKAGQHAGSLADCDELLKQNPPGADLDRVRELRRLLLRKE